MENRSHLPGEPSLAHPGVPTGRGGHPAGVKPLSGIPRRLFLGLPALYVRLKDHNHDEKSLTPFPRREIGRMAENGKSLPFARGAFP